MTLSLETIDKIFDFLPKDVVSLIYPYYDSRCPSCNEEMALCSNCEIYFCVYHICFSHTTRCAICYKHQCPYKEFYRICSCHTNKLCEFCYFNGEEVKRLQIMASPINIINQLILSLSEIQEDHAEVSLGTTQLYYEPILDEDTDEDMLDLE